MSDTLVLSNSTATNEVRELTADELELIAGGNCNMYLAEGAAKGAVAGAIGGSFAGIAGIAGGALLGGLGGMAAEGLDCFKS